MWEYKPDFVFGFTGYVLTYYVFVSFFEYHIHSYLYEKIVDGCADRYMA